MSNLQDMAKCLSNSRQSSFVSNRTIYSRLRKRAFWEETASTVFFTRFGERRVRACHHPMPVPWPDVPNVLMTRRRGGNSTRKRNIRCNYLFGPFDEGGGNGLGFDGWTSFVTAVTVPHSNTNISYVVSVSKSLLLVI